MSAKNLNFKTGINQGSSVIGRGEPIAHPKNCKHECPYGYNKPFCFPCYKKIMAEMRGISADGAAKA